MKKVENKKKYNHSQTKMNSIYDLGNPFREKTELEVEVAMLPFSLSGNG